MADGGPGADVRARGRLSRGTVCRQNVGSLF